MKKGNQGLNKLDPNIICYHSLIKMLKLICMIPMLYHFNYHGDKNIPNYLVLGLLNAKNFQNKPKM